MLAQVCELQVGDLIFDGGDTHIYLNHIDQVNEQLTRSPISLPTLWINPTVKDIDSFTMGDIKLVDYQSHPSINAKMAV
jgi:thymidylate synthase